MDWATCCPGSTCAAPWRRSTGTTSAPIEHVQRVYATSGEAGLLLCTWPRGGRPRFPLVYADEVWTGVEYQLATELIYLGMFAEAFSLVRAVRDRYDGFKRNPWDEIECGHHYVRSMAGWGLLIALSGFGFDLARGEISFAPAVDTEAFSCLWTTGRGWGIYRRETRNLRRNRAGGGRDGWGDEWCPGQSGGQRVDPDLNHDPI